MRQLHSVGDTVKAIETERGTTYTGLPLQRLINFVDAVTNTVEDDSLLAGEPTMMDILLGRRDK